jgi:cytoskeletal protein RodZ
MKKLLITLAVIVSVVAGFAIWQAHRPRRTPAGQPPLDPLSAQNFSDFTSAFNRSTSSARLVLLLSPT